MRNIIIPIFMLFAAFTAQGQVTKTFHETYSLEDISSVELDVAGEVTLLRWHGTTLMAETNIRLENATTSILRHLSTKKKRYDLQSEVAGEQLIVSSVDKERKTIMTQSGTCDEYVNITIYVPEEFKIESKTRLVRVEESSTTGDE